MKFTDLTKRTSQWLRGIGPMHDIVVSSRVRFARNITGVPFVSKATKEQAESITTRMQEVIEEAKLFDDMLYVDVASLGKLQRRLLIERHLISRQHSIASNPRSVAISGDETASIMVNEEDHLRIQVIRPGMQLHEAFEEINRIDDEISQHVEYAFSPKLGYLTACPTNVGTGLRVSAMLHLPGLKLTGELDKTLRAARDMRMAIRGIYGEGSEAMGDFFQISNQVTLGVSEQQIVDEFINIIIPEILTYERAARDVLLRNHMNEVDDKIYRALAILQSARKMCSEEAMFLLSMIRLGVNVRKLNSISLKDLNEIFLSIQPAHLQRLNESANTKDKRQQERAKYLREKFADVS